MKRKKSIGKSVKFERIAKIYWTLVVFASPLIAFGADFKTGLAKAAGYGVYLSIGMAAFFLIEGIWNYRQGSPFFKDIIGVIVCAGAFAITGAIYAAFGVSATITPDFN